MKGIKQCPNCQKPIHNEVTCTVTNLKVNTLVADLMKEISKMVGEHIPEDISGVGKMSMYQLNFLSAVMQITSAMLEQAPTSIAWSLALLKKRNEKQN